MKVITKLKLLVATVIYITFSYFILTTRIGQFNRMDNVLKITIFFLVSTIYFGESLKTLFNNSRMSKKHKLCKFCGSSDTKILDHNLTEKTNDNSEIDYSEILLTLFCCCNDCGKSYRLVYESKTKWNFLRWVDDSK